MTQCGIIYCVYTPVGIKYLPFLDLGSDAVVLPPADDAHSSVIPIPAGLPFGRVMHKAIYVRMLVVVKLVPMIGMYLHPLSLINVNGFQLNWKRL